MTTLVRRLRCEHLCDPMGIHTSRPRLSWQVLSDQQNSRQVAYQVLVSSSAELLAAGEGDLWDSGRVHSDECWLVPYDGRALRSRDRAHWSVRVWEERGEPSAFAPAARWEMGLLEEADWQAEWVTAGPSSEPSAVTYLRSCLRLDAPVRRARAYVTALGIYDLSCNGIRVGDARLSPGWTDYAQRIHYQVLDMTHLLVEGDNALEVRLADGWYAGYVGFQGERAHYGSTPQLLAQFEVDTEDGRIVHSTGRNWTVSRGPIRTSDILRGETHDRRHRLELEQAARVADGTAAQRLVSPAPPVRVLDERPAVHVERTESTHRIDFGQNLVGWVRLRVRGRQGDIVSVRHAEVLRPDGSLYVENLRTAAATDRYVLGEDEVQVLEPSFTFHGFRYAEVSGYEGELRPQDVVAVVCGSDLERTGDFSCSEEPINQLHSNILWSARGNFLDIPTDCPQRDERMGWTGDAQVFAPTACYLFDTAGFFTKWLRDMKDAQTPDGSFPDVVPRIILASEGSAGWADAGVVVPWILWRQYADRGLLEEMYPSMRAWVDHVHRANPDLLWLSARGYDNGDWLAAHAETDKDLIATAYFARSARLTARTADVLGRTGEAAGLHDLADRIVAAFREAYLLPDSRLKCETQTAYALALRFELLPAEAVARAASHLAADVEAHDTHLTTGFLGVGQLLPALTEGGHEDLAYRLLHQDAYPSWLHAVRAGATTIWERWDGWTPEAGYGDPAMNSYNHYALGSVGEWFYSTVAGIAYLAPGGRRLRLAPRPDRSMTWARARHMSPYGVIRCGWQRLRPDALRIDVEVPVGATAEVDIAAPPTASVRHEGRDVSDAPTMTFLSRSDTTCRVEIGSGSYSFEVTQPSMALPDQLHETREVRHARSHRA